MLSLILEALIFLKVENKDRRGSGLDLARILLLGSAARFLANQIENVIDLLILHTNHDRRVATA